MQISEPLEEEPQFSEALEEALNQAVPYRIPGKCWEPAVAEGRPFLRLFFGDHWWTLRLHSETWSRGRRTAFESVVSGEALAGELLLSRALPQHGRPARGIVCKTVAWFPLRPPLPSWNDRAVFSRHNIEEIDIKNLRDAIRANWVSFPSQIPTFPSSGWPELQCKLVQLYFVLGWNCTDIAIRYGIDEQRVRAVLHGWKWRAANAGYIQHIPVEQPVTRLKIKALTGDGTSESFVSRAMHPR